MRFLSPAALFVLLFCWNPSAAQDILYLPDGSSVIGNATIEYRPDYDVVRMLPAGSSLEESYPVTEIDSLVFRNGERHFPRTVWHVRFDEEIQKTALLAQLLTGTVNLYGYEGEGFDYVVERGAELHVLQQFPPYMATEHVLTFQTVKLILFQDCADRDYLLGVRFKRNPILGLVNTFNKCMNPGYAPLVQASEKRDIKMFSIGLGVKTAALDFHAPIVEKYPSPADGPPIYVTRGEFFAQNSISASFDIEASLYDNLWSSEILFLHFGFGYSNYIFELNSSNDIYSPEKLQYSRATAMFGPAFQIDLSPKVRSRFTISSLVWVPAFRRETHYTPSTGAIPQVEYILVPINAQKNIGTNLQLKSDFTFLIRNFELYLGAKASVFPEKNVLTHNYGRYYPNWVARLSGDEFSRQISVTLGLNFYNKRTGFF